MQPHHPNAPQVRASDAERDAVIQRLQTAFAEGRLTDEEFDTRMRTALEARTHADLDAQLADLPTPAPTPGAAPATTPRPRRFTLAYKNAIRYGGRWRVPERHTTVAYKGGCLLDLRAAELTTPVTTLVALAYKSRIELIVPPGVRVELDGVGVSRGWADDDLAEATLPPNAPVIHVRGYAYKGRVEARNTPSRR